MENCIFCKISKGDQKAEIVLKNEHLVAFKDINPQAPTHVLIIPRKHIATINDIENEDKYLIGEMIHAAKIISNNLNFDKNGYRLVFNCNSDGGQEVYHIHLHLLAGRKLGWPPG